MANPEELPGVDGADRQQSDAVPAVRETVCVSEWLQSTRCARCGRRILYAGDGRPPKYCRDSHRKRAAMVRTVQRRVARPVDKASQTTEPVRDVVERIETRTLTTAHYLSKAPSPEASEDWQHALKQLRNQVRGGPGLAESQDLLVSDLEEAVRFVRDHHQHVQQATAPVPSPCPPRAGQQEEAPQAVKAVR